MLCHITTLLTSSGETEQMLCLITIIFTATVTQNIIYLVSYNEIIASSVKQTDVGHRTYRVPFSVSLAGFNTYSHIFSCRI